MMKEHHALERTSPLGTAFVGTCFKCGKKGLTMNDFMLDECENVRGLSQDEALIEAINNDPHTSTVQEDK